MKKSLSLLCVILGICVLLSSTIFSQELAKQQILRYATDDRDLGSNDPIKTGTHGNYPIQNMIFESLVRYKPGSPSIDEIEPALATEWTVSEDGKAWEFKLRKGVQWHKGYGEFTSEDVKYSFERAMDSDISEHASKYNNIERIETPDDYTVIFYLKDMDAFFLLKVVNKFSGWLTCKAAVEEMGDEYGLMPVGTGPFQITEYLAKEKVVLERNEGYWRGKPQLEKVEFLLMPDDTSRTMALINGEVDVIRGFVSPEWFDMVTSNGMKIGYGLPGQIILNFNMHQKPFDDIRVRKAFAYAIGREAVIDYYGGTADEQLTALPSFVFSALDKEDLPPALRYEKDVEKAKELLAQAGYPNGLVVETVISEHPDYLTPTEIWQEEFKEAGIELKLIKTDHPSFHERIRTDQYPLVVYGGVREPLADTWLYQWYHSDADVGLPSGVTNFSHYGHVDANGDGMVDSVDYYIEAARKTMDQTKQKTYWELAQYQLLKDLPVFPSHVVNILFAYQPYVDLGYEMEGSVIDGVEVWEDTRILRH